MGKFIKTGNHVKRNCRYCNHETTASVLPVHEKNCYLNPLNLKECPICDKPIKKWKRNKTCSYSCANKFTKSGSNNGNWKESTYRTTCFGRHKKQCVICGEDKIVAVHHFDGNRDNNKVENLIPICPTHHQYCHSRYYSEIRNIIEEYVKKFIGGEV